MIIDCISDLHGDFPNLAGGDLLIIAGDCTTNDSIPAWNNFFDWLDQQDYKKKVMIAGNHDNWCKQWATSDDSIHDILEGRPSVTYLCDSGTEFEGLKIWGSPWSLWFHGINPHCKAFTGSESRLMDSYDKIPKGIDILITHTPPHGVLDHCRNGNVGSKSLYAWLKYVERPKLHVFGHIHEGYGMREVFPTYDDKMMISVNASIMNEFYEPVNQPIRIEL